MTLDQYIDLMTCTDDQKKQLRIELSRMLRAAQEGSDGIDQNNLADFIYDMQGSTQNRYVNGEWIDDGTPDNRYAWIDELSHASDDELAEALYCSIEVPRSWYDYWPWPERIYSPDCNAYRLDGFIPLEAFGTAKYGEHEAALDALEAYHAKLFGSQADTNDEDVMLDTPG